MNSISSNLKHKILITEDDIENQKYLQLILKRDFEVDICDSEKSFYEKLTSNKYDAILMDVSLKGGKNGIDIIRELRKNPTYGSIPVVCLSAHVFRHQQDEAKDAGVDVYLTKPVDNQRLIGTLRKLTGKEKIS